MIIDILCANIKNSTVISTRIGELVTIQIAEIALIVDPV